MEIEHDRILVDADLPFKHGDLLIVKDNVTDIGREVNRILSEAGRPERMRLALDSENEPKYIGISDIDGWNLTQGECLELDGNDVTFSFKTNRKVFDLLYEKYVLVQDFQNGLFKISMGGMRPRYKTEVKVSVKIPNPVLFEFRIKKLAALQFSIPESWAKLIPIRAD